MSTLPETFEKAVRVMTLEQLLAQLQILSAAAGDGENDPQENPDCKVIVQEVKGRFAALTAPKGFNPSQTSQPDHLGAPAHSTTSTDPHGIRAIRIR